MLHFYSETTQAMINLQSLLKRWAEKTGLGAIRNVPETVKNYHAITIQHWAFKFP